jgi:predicted ribosome quality control (RQC) complex YloA/Tae2 family protein
VGDKERLRPESAPSRSPYSLLNLPEKPPPELEGGNGRVPELARRSIPRLIAGIDPVAAEVISEHFEGDPERVWEYLRTIPERLQSASHRWRCYSRGEKTVIYPVSLPFAGPPLAEGSYSEAMEPHLERTVFPAFLEELREQAGSSAAREQKKLRRLLENLERDRSRAERHREYFRYGNLLTSNFHRMSKGMEEIALKTPSGEEVTIELKKELSPQENVKRYFRMARKGEAGLEKIGRRMEQTERKLRRISEMMEKIEASRDPDYLYRYIETEPESGGGSSGGTPDEFRKFTIEGKYTVYVGRNARENDRLTHWFASGSDLWFHARGVPGSHVILRGANRSTPPRILKKVAAIAAFYSKSRNAELVPVSYTEKRYVRKPRKSPPGTARLDRESTLFVNPSIPDEKSS